MAVKLYAEHIVYGKCWLRGALRRDSGAVFEAQLEDKGWKLLLAAPQYWRESEAEIMAAFATLEKVTHKRIAALAQSGNPSALRRDKVVGLGTVERPELEDVDEVADLEEPDGADEEIQELVGSPFGK